MCILKKIGQLRVALVKSHGNATPVDYRFLEKGYHKNETESGISSWCLR